MAWSGYTQHVPERACMARTLEERGVRDGSIEARTVTPRAQGYVDGGNLAGALALGAGGVHMPSETQCSDAVLHLWGIQAPVTRSKMTRSSP